MPEPAYVSIAGEYARRIRSGELPPGMQLPSYTEIAHQHSVSDIVVRKAVELLQSQGLVRSVRRRGIFVTDRLNLVRISPERQMEDPETSFRNESDQEIQISRETRQISAGEELAEAFEILPTEKVVHTVTRATEGGRPISISDTYQPLSARDISTATILEEALSDQLPTSTHSAWLGVTHGDLVKTIHQQFFDADDKLIMISDVSYPRDRYDAFVFRMTLTPDNRSTNQ